MTAPNLTNRFLLELGDGGDPETFGFPCGAQTRSFTITNNLDEATVMDCDDPLDTQAAIVRSLISSDTGASISGRVSKEYLSAWIAFAGQTTPKNVRATFDEAGADGGGYWTIPMFLQSFEISSEGQTTATFTASLVGAGARAWTAAA